MRQVALIIVLFVLLIVTNLFIELYQKNVKAPVVEYPKTAFFLPEFSPQNPSVAFGDILTKVLKPKKLTVSKVLSSASRQVKIAIIGDSMTEFLGSGEKLKWTLKEYYPNYEFEIINMGVGSTNIDYAFSRITTGYDYKGQFFPSINDLHPDITVLESFAYNQYDTDPGVVDAYKRKLTDIVHTIEWNVGSRVAVMATLSPDAVNYAKGILDLTPEARAKIVEEKKTYLRAAVEVGKSLGIPIIDVFSATVGDGDGRDDLVEDETNIHPSAAGVQFLEDFIARELIKAKVL